MAVLVWLRASERISVRDFAMVDCDFVPCAIVVEENRRHDRCPRDHFGREPYLRHGRPRADVARHAARRRVRARRPMR
jgi:hypothetical protein